MNTTDLIPELIKVGDIVTNTNGSKIWIVLDKWPTKYRSTYMFSYIDFDGNIKNTVFDTKIRVLNREIQLY